MSEKTAMMELIEKIKERMALLPYNSTPSETAAYDAYFNCLVWAESLRDGKEKQQIIDACNAGLSGVPRSAEQYYTQTYKHK